MIQSLHIKDFALIDELEVSFGQGLNILTGQTGAGKSIIIGALNMILGERADTEVIRRGADKAISEATIKYFESETLKNLLTENEVELGAGRAFVNGATLKRRLVQSAALLCHFFAQNVTKLC